MHIVNYPAKGKARLRIGRHSDPGRIYLVTFVTAGRRRVFDRWEIALVASRVLSVNALWLDSRLLCWVLMPDHWHGLIELGATESLSTLVGRLKGTMAFSTNLACGCKGPLWTRGFHDHALRSNDDLVDAARYIVLNPVRAGLVLRVGLYPFWDAVCLSGREHRG